MDVFEAVADPTRRRLLSRLAHGPLTAGELADTEPVSRPATSRHLRHLVEAGAVEVEKDGRFRRYRLRRTGLEPLHRLLDELAAPPPIAPEALDALDLEVRRTVRDHTTIERDQQVDRDQQGETA